MSDFSEPHLPEPPGSEPEPTMEELRDEFNELPFERQTEILRELVKQGALKVDDRRANMPSEDD